MKKSRVLLAGLYFGEAPRWHQGRLWFSDFYDRVVKSVDGSGAVRTEVQLEDQPSGLGWLPDGSLLIVSMRQQSLLRFHKGKLTPYADLSAWSRHLANDLVVDRQGRAWVGNFGFDLDTALESTAPEELLAAHPRANLVGVAPGGQVYCAAPNMSFPNGMVVTPDGSTLIVAETLALRLTAFTIAPNGELSERRVWAQLGPVAPDGICMNADGNIWVANALAPQCLLFASGGEQLDAVQTRMNCYACALGGPSGSDLFMMTAPDSAARVAAAARRGCVETCPVEVPAAPAA